jgi:glycosyltransferase domain-containing protein
MGSLKSFDPSASPYGRKCTIVIPTHNRPHYLARTLGYLSKFGREAPIIIADSGDTKTQIANKETISSFSSLDIVYRTHAVSSEPFGGFESKIIDALNLSDTKYCVLSADDDLIAPVGISRCVDFLENNPDYAVAHGQYLYFWADSKFRNSLGWKPVYDGRSVTHPDPAYRLVYHLSRYPTDTTYYAVHQTAFLKHMLQKVVESGLKSVVFRELYSTGITVIRGKTKHLNVFYCAKDRCSERVQQVPDMRELRATSAYSDEQNKFSEILAHYLSEHVGLLPRVSRTAVDTAFSGYSDRALHRNQTYLQRSVMSARGNLYSKKMGWAYEYPKRAYRRIFPKDAYSVMRGQYWIALRSRFWANYDDFRNAGQFVVAGSRN